MARVQALGEQAAMMLTDCQTFLLQALAVDAAVGTRRVTIVVEGRIRFLSPISLHVPLLQQWYNLVSFPLRRTM